MPRGSALALLVVAATVAAPAAADETSATDKLRILYSTRFTFTDDGLPLVTVEIMSGQKVVHLRARSGMTAAMRGRSPSRMRGRRCCRTGRWWRRCSPRTRPA
jgi:hypothetical protein